VGDTSCKESLDESKTQLGIILKSTKTASKLCKKLLTDYGNPYEGLRRFS